MKREEMIKSLEELQNSFHIAITCNNREIKQFYLTEEECIILRQACIEEKHRLKGFDK